MTAIESEQLCIGGDTLSLSPSLSWVYPLLSPPEGNKVSVVPPISLSTLLDGGGMDDGSELWQTNV